MTTVPLKIAKKKIIYSLTASRQSLAIINYFYEKQKLTASRNANLSQRGS